jgi:hypothetical protein
MRPFAVTEDDSVRGRVLSDPPRVLITQDGYLLRATPAGQRIRDHHQARRLP